MKTTIRVFAAAAMLIAASTPAFAQGGGGMGGRGNSAEMQAQRRAMLFEGITLTDAQKVQVDSIFDAAQKAQVELMQNAGGDREAMMNARQQIQTKQNEGLKKVLSADQFKKYEENLARMPQGRGGRGGRGGGNI